ncbi:MAG: lactoylglutathione lyase [Caulobacteraceae bacterium]
MAMSPTTGFVLNQTMLRIRDPALSIGFYRDILGMTLLDRYDFPPMRFSLYFMGYPQDGAPADRGERVEWVFRQPALLELTHNWGTESDPDFHYHDGNAELRGFGHIGVSVPDVAEACRRFEARHVRQAPGRRCDEGHCLRERPRRLLDRDTLGREPEDNHLPSRSVTEGGILNSAPCARRWRRPAKVDSVARPPALAAAAPSGQLLKRLLAEGEADHTEK